MNVKRILLASFLVLIAGSAFGWLTCGWLFNWVYILEPTSAWKSAEAMMSATNLAGSIVVGLLASVIFVVIYAFLHKGLPYKGVKKGLIYGLITWFIGALSGIPGMAFYTTINVIVIVYWVIQALFTALINGAIVGAIYKEK